MATDARTSEFNIEKPHIDNTVAEDLARLITALDKIDAYLKANADAIAGKSDAGHIHDLEAVSGLPAQLAEITASISEHNHALSGLSDVDAAGLSEGMVLQYLAGKFKAVTARAEYFAITAIAGLAANNVQDALQEITAAVSGAVTQADIDAGIESVLNAPPSTLDTLNELAAALGDDPNFATTMTTALAGKASASDITSLQNALNGKLSTAGTAANANKLDNLDSSQFVRSDAGDTMSGNYTITGDLTVQGSDLTIGKNGGGDARLHFYDDGSNTPRTMFWDDSANKFKLEMDTGASYPIAMYYEGSTRDEVTFPLGHIVLAGASTGTRNATYTVRLSSATTEYSTGGSGSILTGTWRAHGRRGNIEAANFQRTA
ncbi:hypothetical protein [Roseibium sp.]|uniref:hypothetical protein n=3 Tax=Alphaproteobacteria TaxID=28211 RepID=UPI00329A4606